MKHNYSWRTDKLGLVEITGLEKLDREKYKELDDFMQKLLKDLGVNLADPFNE